MKPSVVTGWVCFALVPAAILGALLFQNEVKNRPRGLVKDSNVYFGLMVAMSVLAVVLFLIFLALVLHKQHPPITK
jgi:hypothetical protein